MQHALDEEATRLIEAASLDIAAKDPQRQLVGTLVAGLLYGGLYQSPTRPASLPGGIDSQAPQLQDMGMRRQRKRLPDQCIPDNHAIDLGDQRVGGLGPLAEEVRVGPRWRCGRNVFRPRGCVYLPQGRMILPPCPSNLYHHTRMAQRCAPRLMLQDLIRAARCEFQLPHRHHRGTLCRVEDPLLPGAGDRRFTMRLRLEPVDPANTPDLWLVHNDDEVWPWYGNEKPSLGQVERGRNSWTTRGAGASG